MTRRREGADTPRARLLTEERFVIVVAGPNGAGKSTFVDNYIRPSGLRIINPDDIARGLAPLAPASVAYEAADVADALRERLVAAGTSFCMETVFSDPVGSKLGFLKRAQESGYAVFLVFIGLESAALSAARVAQRVEQGGHDIPDDKLEARYPRTLTNLIDAVEFVNHAILLDNSSADVPYRFVAEFDQGVLIRQGNRIPKWLIGIIPKDR
jgi:predicted ABC-type ATPase